MKNKPRIRFKGFTEDWEQRKLIDIAKTFIGLVTTMTENYRDSGTLLIRNSDIKEGQFVFSENPIHLDEEFAEKNKTRKLQTGDVVTVHTGDIGTSAVIEEKEAGAIGFATINTRTDKSILNPYFLATYFNTEKHKCYANSVSTGDGRSNYNIKDFNKLVISIPTLDEQERISVLINDINTIITLHQRKLKNLKLVKKALLQKLFPKNGSQFPEIRFKGFTDAWEQCKFVDLLDPENGIRRGPFGSSLKKDSFVKKSDYVVYEQQNAIYDNYETRYFISREKYNELIRFNIQPGDFIMSGAGTIGRISMVPDGIKKGVFNQALIRFKVNKDSVDPLYFLKFMQSDMMQKQLTQANPGSAMTNLVPMDELKKWNIVIPSFEEQNRISIFIKQIDDVITLHQRKLDRLQEVKKGLLQKMFV